MHYQFRTIIIRKMRSLVLLASFAVVVLSAPAVHEDVYSSPPYLRILPAIRHEEVHDEYGQYAYRYITAENTVVSERGRLVVGSNGGYVLLIEGQYSFIGDDGQLYVTRYRAGPDGFQVDGDHLPQPVPVPKNN